MLVPATADMARNLAPHLRPWDLEEIRLTRPGVPTEKVIEEAIRLSRSPIAWVEDCRVVAVAGVVPLVVDHGSLWMLARPLTRRQEIRLAREAAVFIQDSGFSSLVVQLHERNADAHRLLDWLGFTPPGRHLHAPPPIATRYLWNI